MSVYQVERYYICTTGLKISADQKAAIENLLSDEGYSNYEFQDGGQIVVDDFGCKWEAQKLEDKIYKLAGV